MLTNADRTALMQAAHKCDLAGCACLEVFDAVEAIVAAHVAAALNSAAEAIESAYDVGCTCEVCDTSAICARIVRANTT